MSKETKFGYGFLLVGTGVPYLIDKLFGLPFAILISLACVIVGCALLWAGHRHKDNQPPKKIWNWLAIGACLSTLVVLSWVGIMRIVPKSKNQPSVSTAQESKKEQRPKEEPRLSESPKATHKQTSAPYRIQIDSALAGSAPVPGQPSFWVAYIGPHGPSVSPASVILFLRFTNLQGQPAMVDKYSVSVHGKKLTKLSVPPMEVFFASNGDLHRACWLDDEDIIDKKILGLNLQPRVPVEGWSLLQWPKGIKAPENLDEFKKTTFHVSLTDVEGVSFAVEPIIKQDTANESAQGRWMDFSRGTRDLSRYRLMNFAGPAPYSPPEL